MTSAVVRLRPRVFAHGKADSPQMLARVVRQAFGQRRKTLRNALSGVLDAQRLQQMGIEPVRRPETLSVVEFVAISNAAHALRESAG